MTLPAEPNSVPNQDKATTDTLPLEFQAMIRGQRASAIIMAIISALSILFIPWAIFYIVLATLLNPKKVPNRGLVKAAAIATLPLCLGIIPIIIDIEFWKMDTRLGEYEEKGAKAFMSDEEYQKGEPKRKRSRRIAWSVLLSILAIFLVLIIAAIVTSSLNGNKQSSSLLDGETPTPYISSEHGFVIDFPGFPATKHSNIDVDGVPVPYTYYSTETDDGNKSYVVQIAQYPLSDFNLAGQERGSLDGAINGMAQSEGMTLVTSSNNGTFLGYPAAEASFTVNQDGHTYDMYSVDFVKGNDLYLLMSVGGNKPEFDTFVSSFKFK